MTDFGKEKKVGFALHGEIFKKSFEDLNIELIDFLGADRSKGRKYVKFKSRWGGEFVKHPGSFTKLVIF